MSFSSFLVFFLVAFTILHPSDCIFPIAFFFLTSKWPISPFPLHLSVWPSSFEKLRINFCRKFLCCGSELAFCFLTGSNANLFFGVSFHCLVFSLFETSFFSCFEHWFLDFFSSRLEICQIYGFFVSDQLIFMSDMIHIW